MACDFDPAFVCGVDRGFQFRPRNVHVRFERSDAAIGPIFHELARVVWTGEVGHLDEIAVGAFEIGASYVEVGTWQLACVNFALEVEVGVGFHASRGAHRGDAAG